MAPQSASDPHRDMRTPIRVRPTETRRPGIAARVLRWANRPWTSGLTGFATTVLVMLPLEYEAPLRTLMLFFSTRRP